MKMCPSAESSLSEWLAVNCTVAKQMEGTERRAGEATSRRSRGMTLHLGLEVGCDVNGGFSPGRLTRRAAHQVMERSPQAAARPLLAARGRAPPPTARRH